MSTLTFCCGAECGILAVGSTMTAFKKHWDTVTASPTISTAAPRSGGNNCYQFAASGSAVSMAKTIAAGNRLVVTRFAIRPTVYPGATAETMRMGGPSSNFRPSLWIGSTGTLYAGFGASYLQAGAIAPLNTWTLVDMRHTTSGTTYSIDWYVNGAIQTQYTKGSATAADMTSMTIGVYSASVTMTMQYDDIALSFTTGDFPIGNAGIRGYSPNADGTHSFTAGNFKYNNSTNVLVAATDVYTYLDDPALTSVSDYISQNVINASGYIEVGFADTPTGATVRGVEVVSANHAASTLADTCTLKLNDGGTLANVYAGADVSNAAITYISIPFATKPSGGAWTKATFDALKAQWGFSSDVTDIPFLDGLMLEAEVGDIPGDVTGVVTGAPAAGVAPTVVGTTWATVTVPGPGTAPADTVVPTVVGTTWATVIVPESVTAAAAGLAPTTSPAVAVGQTASLFTAVGIPLFG